MSYLNDWWRVFFGGMEYPYTDSCRYNDDWLLEVVKKLVEEFANFVNLNKIKYANPIGWDITRQYEANTVVVDNRTGNAYISVKPVPSGVQINNTEYWTQIYNYASVIETLRNQIAFDEGNTTTATRPYAVNDLVFVNGILYKVIAPMIAGDTFVVNSNIEHTTIESLIKREAEIREAVDNALGTRITEEATTREAVDNALGTRITEESNALGARITEEATTREAVDNALGTRITNEVATREPNLQNREFLVVGDSYGDEAGEWASLVPDMLQINSNKWHNVCVGGAGFISNGTLTFLAQLTNYAGDKNAITDIIVCGGLNDSFSTSVSDTWWTNLASAMLAFDEYVKANYPNATISLGYVGNGLDYESGSAIGTRVFEARQMCKYFYTENAENLGWKILHNVEYALCTNYANMSSDGVHPSGAGSYALAHAITEAILSGAADVRYPKYDATNSDSKLQYTIVNGRTSLHIRNYNIPVGAANTIPASAEWQTFNNLYFNRVTEKLAVARLDNFNELPFQYVAARLQFQGNKLRVELNATDSTGAFINGYVAGDNAYLRLLDCDLDINTEYLA